MVKNPVTQDPGPAVAAAIELLIRKGYNATSVDDLADAIGISRSTFFRKFGSKEDMVFAGHERILTRVDDGLATAAADPLKAVVGEAQMVFDLHIRDRETSLLRNRLLHQVPGLRDRELVTTHRYERSFRHYLQSALPDTEGRDYGAVAFAAAVVAVHNRVLREWLRDVGDGSDHQLDKAAAARLRRELRTLVSIFQPALLPSAVSVPSPPAVVVAVLNPEAGTEQILEALRQALG